MELNNDQLFNETTQWNSLLEHYRIENTILKNRLALLLDKDISENKLSAAEHFQNEFLRRDQIINILKHDINKQVKILKEEYSQNNTLFNKESIANLYSLRNHIYSFENEFNQQLEEFQLFISSIK